MNVFFTLVKIFELISFKFGFDISGLADELKNDREVMNCLKEKLLYLQKQEHNQLRN